MSKIANKKSKTKSPLKPQNLQGKSINFLADFDSNYSFLENTLQLITLNKVHKKKKGSCHALKEEKSDPNKSPLQGFKRS